MTNVILVSLLLIFNIFIHFSTVSIVDLEQVNASWGYSYISWSVNFGNTEQSDWIFQEKKQTSTISKIRTLLENYLDNIDILY